MAKFNAKALAAMKEVFDKSTYIKRTWKTDESLTMTLQEYGELVNPAFQHVVENPIIIAKENKKGGWFYKMLFTLSGESVAEYELSYQLKDDDYNGPEFDEGDEIDKDTIRFCIEKFLDKEHGYVTGEVI